MEYYVKRIKREIELGIIDEDDVFFTLQSVYRVNPQIRDSVMKEIFPDYEPKKPKMRELTEEERKILELFKQQV